MGSRLDAKFVRKFEEMSSWIFLLGFIWLTATLNGVPADPAVQLLGLSPLDEKYFKSEVIKCKDGSKSFVRARLNDGFCDCPDGTDEPGTPACPEGRFFCRNSGHMPLILFSSRVNDGICDCCDGSDEYDGKIKCPNTCWEAGKAAREKLKKKISTFQEGSAIRKREIEHAKQAIAKEEAELSKLKKEEKLLKDLVDKLKEHTQQIEKAEEEEHLKKQKEAEKSKQTEKKINEQVNDPEETPPATPDEAVEESPESPDQHAVEDVDLGNEFEQDGSDVSNKASGLNEEKKKESFENTEGLSKEELGRVVASRWTGQHSDDHTEELHRTGDIEDDDDSGTPENGMDEEYDGYPSDSGGHDRTYGDEIESDSLEEDEDDVEEHADHDISNTPDLVDATNISVIGASSWLDKLRQSFQAVLQSLKLFKTPVNTSDASRVRKEYDDYSGKLLKMQSRISSLSEKLKTDLGPEKEFYSFYDSCFETKQDKYVYKVCPFKQASQVEGHSTTRLGRWEKFEEAYRVMHFSNGDRCWNGPGRSLKVRLRCGLKNELVDVDEPSRCEYVAVMLSPAVCLEERLKELQDKLDSMNEGRMEGHDEL